MSNRGRNIVSWTLWIGGTFVVMTFWKSNWELYLFGVIVGQITGWIAATQDARWRPFPPPRPDWPTDGFQVSDHTVRLKNCQAWK